MPSKRKKKALDVMKGGIMGRTVKARSAGSILDQIKASRKKPKKTAKK